MTTDKLNWIVLQTIFFFIVLIILMPLLTLLIASFMSSESLYNGIPSVTYAVGNFINFDEFELRLYSIFSDKLLIGSLIQSLITSGLCGLTVALFSWVAGYAYSRSTHILIKVSMPVVLTTYLMPPVTLVLTLSTAFKTIGGISSEVAIFIGHCIYLFPLGYVLSIGFWSQKSYEIDQLAIVDGGGKWDGFVLNHGGKELSYFSVIALLVFMVSWGDIIFSRVLASNDNNARLLVDLIFQKLFSNSEIEAYGEITLFSLIVIFISFILSALFSILFVKSTSLRG